MGNVQQYGFGFGFGQVVVMRAMICKAMWSNFQREERLSRKGRPILYPGFGGRRSDDEECLACLHNDSEVVSPY